MGFLRTRRDRFARPRAACASGSDRSSRPARRAADPPRGAGAAGAHRRGAGAPAQARAVRSWCGSTASSGPTARRRSSSSCADAQRYARRGYLVELQVRYHPTPQQEGDIAAWAKHVREVVDRFGAHPRVVGAPDHERGQLRLLAGLVGRRLRTARQEALIQGVIAAKDEARASTGFGRLKIGFNWAYRYDPAHEQALLGLPARPTAGAVRRGARLGRPRRLPRHVLPAGRGAGRRLARRRWSTR